MRIAVAYRSTLLGSLVKSGTSRRTTAASMPPTAGLIKYAKARPIKS